MSHEVKYIGMDVHKEAIVIAVLDGSGKLVMETIVETKASSITEVSQVRPIKVYFPISEQEYLRMADGGGPGSVDFITHASRVPLQMTLADGSAYPHPGRIIFADRQVNMQTGTIQIVGEFPNARNFLRPLMMTALAFILGCVPLWTASGAGAVARQIMGTAVIGGMLAETFIGRFFVPAIFYVVEKVSGAERRRPLALTPAEAPSQGD